MFRRDKPSSSDEEQELSDSCAQRLSPATDRSTGGTFPSERSVPGPERRMLRDKQSRPEPAGPAAAPAAEPGSENPRGAAGKRLSRTRRSASGAVPGHGDAAEALWG